MLVLILANNLAWLLGSGVASYKEEGQQYIAA